MTINVILNTKLLTSLFINIDYFLRLFKLSEIDHTKKYYFLFTTHRIDYNMKELVNRVNDYIQLNKGQDA